MTNTSKLAAVLLACCLAQAANAQPAPGRPDETGIIETADTYHILLRSEADAARIRAQIDEVQPAQRFSRFKKIAASASIDPGSSAKGGSLGTIYRGEMTARFEKAIFGSGPESVIGPFPSEFGWHLAYVERFGKEQVSAICQASVKKAYAQASGAARQGLSPALVHAERAELPARVEPLLGVGWQGPLMDEKRNLLYVQARRQPTADSVQILTRHIEFTSAQLVVASEQPFSCARSLQEQWAIDCQRDTVALLSIAEYEGRGARGRRLTDMVLDPSKVQNSAGASGSGRQFIEFACKNSPLSVRPR